MFSVSLEYLAFYLYKKKHNGQKKIFEITGPLVENENLSLFEPSLPGEKMISMKRQ